MNVGITTTIEKGKYYSKLFIIIGEGVGSTASDSRDKAEQSAPFIHDLAHRLKSTPKKGEELDIPELGMRVETNGKLFRLMYRNTLVRETHRWTIIEQIIIATMIYKYHTTKQ